MKIIILFFFVRSLKVLDVCGKKLWNWILLVLIKFKRIKIFCCRKKKNNYIEVVSGMFVRFFKNN